MACLSTFGWSLWQMMVHIPVPFHPSWENTHIQHPNSNVATLSRALFFLSVSVRNGGRHIKRHVANDDSAGFYAFLGPKRLWRVDGTSQVLVLWGSWMLRKKHVGSNLGWKFTLTKQFEKSLSCILTNRHLLISSESVATPSFLLSMLNLHPLMLFFFIGVPKILVIRCAPAAVDRASWLSEPLLCDQPWSRESCRSLSRLVSFGEFWEAPKFSPSSDPWHKGNT